MKNLSILILLFSAVFGFGQEISKSDILKIFRTGDQIRYNLENYRNGKETYGFTNSEHKIKLKEFLKDEKFNNIDYEILPNMYFDPATGYYIFSIICAKKIENESDWGLNDYVFIYEIKMDFNKTNKEATIIQSKVYDNNSDLKSWWQGFMDTYMEDKYLRNKWGKELGFIPPPPPPPQSVDWFEK